ncbi:MAG TPA: hypothetical protein VNR68_08070 [Sphingomicrobium sp.]|nr:hypothetical protein [Sphingomicrobium sp.]
MTEDEIKSAQMGREAPVPFSEAWWSSRGYDELKSMLAEGYAGDHFARAAREIERRSQADFAAEDAQAEVRSRRALSAARIALAAVIAILVIMLAVLVTQMIG